jgi:hypothetical protein
MANFSPVTKFNSRDYLNKIASFKISTYLKCLIEFQANFVRNQIANLFIYLGEKLLDIHANKFEFLSTSGLDIKTHV